MIIYFIATVSLTFGWQRMQPFKFIAPNEITLISLIVPVRNEAKNLPNLLTDLQAQSNQNFELILVNDAPRIKLWRLLRFQTPLPVSQLRFSTPTEAKIVHQKSLPFRRELQIAKGKLITTTDGDCRVGKHWLRDIHGFYQTEKPKLISAGVTFCNEQTWFDKIQTVEFMSLIGAGAVSMNLGTPNMCNGANLTYEKQAFEDVNGFSGSEQLASGDDEFLMHKIFKKFPQDVKFLKSEVPLSARKRRRIS